MSEWMLDGVPIPTPTTVVYRGKVEQLLAGGLQVDVMSSLPEEPGQQPKALSWKSITEAQWQ